MLPGQSRTCIEPQLLHHGLVECGVFADEAASAVFFHQHPAETGQAGRQEATHHMCSP